MPEPLGQVTEQPKSNFERALSIVGTWNTMPNPDDAAAAQTAKENASQAAPSAPAEETASETTQESTAQPEEAQQPQETATPVKHKLKYRGEEIEVDDEELKSGYLKGRDYTQKTQDIAKERAEIPAKVKAQVEPVVKQYQERLSVFEKALWKALAPEVNNTDWNALARDNPAEWAQKMQAVTNVNNILAGIAQERQRLAAEAQEQQRAALVEKVKEANEILQAKIPDWNAETYAKLVKGSEKYGFTSAEIQQIVDPRAIELLHDALAYRALKEAKPQVEKRVADVPKVVKPGAAEQRDPNADKRNEAMKKLKSTGKTRDAVAAARFFV